MGSGIVDWLSEDHCVEKHFVKKKLLESPEGVENSSAVCQKTQLHTCQLEYRSFYLYRKTFYFSLASI